MTPFTYVSSVTVSCETLDANKFDESEFSMVLSLIPHVEEERDFLIKLIKEIDDNNNDYEFHARNIKKYLISQPAFFDFIIATLVKLAWADHVMDDRENQMIINTKRIFNEKSILVNLIRSFLG